MSFKKILVPTDFSNEADHAFEAAVKIAEISNASIDILHVIDVPSFGQINIGEIMSSTFEEDHENIPPFVNILVKSVNNKADALKEKHPHLTINLHIEFDELAQQLSKFIINKETDLIVIGAKDSSYDDGVFLGSNAVKIIRTANVPVLTIKDNMEEFNFDSIVFSSPFKKISDKTIKAFKTTLALLGYPHIYFLSIITRNNFEESRTTKQRIEDFAQSNDFEDYSIHVENAYTIEEGVKNFSSEIETSIIALTSNHKTGFGHFFQEDHTEEIANQLSHPILTFNEHKR